MDDITKQAFSEVRKELRDRVGKRELKPGKKAENRRAWWGKHKVRLLAGKKANYRRDKTKQKDKDLQRHYGITLAQKTAIKNAQRGLCAICQRPPRGLRDLVVDHCHRTGVVRGLLCNQCNMGIGKLDDDPDILESAIAYLRVPRG